MGCWNETCLLSRLPIVCGQNIACVFIAPVQNWPGTVYTDSQYVPVSLPFYGAYDDYGRIEFIEEDGDAVKSLSGQTLYIRSEHVDENVLVHADVPDAGDPHWEEKIIALVDHARQGRLWTDNAVYAGGKAQVRLAFFHKDLWDYAAGRKAGAVTVDHMKTLLYRWPAARHMPSAQTKWDKLKALAAVDAAMSLMRVAWQPTCGTGSQACVDYPWQAKMYKKFADRAEAFRRSGIS